MLQKLSQRKRVPYSPINEGNGNPIPSAIANYRKQQQMLNKSKHSQEETQSSLNTPNYSTK